MQPNNRPPIIREWDRTGNPIVRVPLDSQGNRWATVDAPDYDRLPEALRTFAWFVNDDGDGREYVKAGAANSPGNLVRVARVISQARPGQAVRYLSSDRCNMRRSNLSLRSSKISKRDHLDEILRDAA